VWWRWRLEKWCTRRVKRCWHAVAVAFYQYARAKVVGGGGGVGVGGVVGVAVVAVGVVGVVVAVVAVVVGDVVVGVVDVVVGVVDVEVRVGDVAGVLVLVVFHSSAVVVCTWSASFSPVDQGHSYFILYT
jgi:hypothetical protein